MQEIKSIPQITIYLIPRDAELFKKFREYQDIFERLLKDGVFDIKMGNATIHFDEQGNIGDIDIIIKKKKKKKLSTVDK